MAYLWKAMEFTGKTVSVPDAFGNPTMRRAINKDAGVNMLRTDRQPSADGI